MATTCASFLLLALGVVEVFGRLAYVKSTSESGKIARGKPVTATSTCGAILPEKYCYSTGAANVVCGICNGDYRIENVTAGHSSYWQSSVLTDDPLGEHVNITINLLQKFQIHRITIATAYTLQPAVWMIEVSQDNGREYHALKYFVTHSVECATKFGLDERDIENGLCIIQETNNTSLSDKADIMLDFSNNVIADHIRVRYIQVRKSNNAEEFDAFSRFYTIKEISVKGVRRSKIGDTQTRTKRQACYCSGKGTAGSICNPVGRVCPCKAGYGGRRCNKCSRGFFDYPKCSACGCSIEGSLSSSCKRDSGQCRCKPSIDGRTCSECRKGFSGFPICNWCGCHIKHTTSQICDKDGKCLCKKNYDGKTCSKCKKGYVDYPECKKPVCSCSLSGSTSIKCNSLGLCQCKKGYTGQKCKRCIEGFYGYPNCKECACHYKGSPFQICDATSGQCYCFPNIAGRQCDRCVSGQFGFPRCRPCICNPYGTKRNAGLGNSICATGKEKFQCQCKKNVGGNTCDVCKDSYFNFSPRSPLGCKSCGCSKEGTIGGLESCDQKTGQCPCKPFIEEGKCYECERGYHSLKSADIFGCSACKCNPGGALYGNCDKRNGRCRCRKYIGGLLCDRLNMEPVYVPSLHHISVEIEDGQSVDGKRLNYNFDLNMFPSFSWKGYVQFSLQQATVVVSVRIPRSSTYRILFRCIFEPVGFPQTTTASFTVSPNAGVPGYTRVVPMTLSSTQNGGNDRSALLSISQNDIDEQFLMFKGTWTVTITCESKYLLMDYLVFMPEEYYEGTILQTERVDPCVVGGPNNKVCDRYSYPEVAHESIVKQEAENGYFSKRAWHADEKLTLKYYSNSKVLKQLGANGMVVMNKEQNRFSVDINIPKTGQYIFIIRYYNPGQTQEKIDMYVHRERGTIHIEPCVYQFGCRQVVMKDIKVVKVFDLDDGWNPLNFFTSEDANIAIDYITAIPLDLWHHTFITPALVCRSLNGKCILSKYEEPTIFERQPPIYRGTEELSTPSKSSSSDLNKVTVVKFRQFFNKLAGDYFVVLQYKQTANALVNGQVSITTYATVSQGVVQFTYCPNTEFCRVLVKPTGQGSAFKIPQGITSVEIRIPYKETVQLAWFYVIPANQFSDEVLSFKPVDNSITYKVRCSSNNYLINPKDNGYCMKSSFALTTYFNNGALRCRCSYYGARSRFCNKVYGQCTCRRPNIIGRQCTRCASGYYGFPFCRRCTCDPKGAVNGDCDRLSRCTCKPNYTGRNCNRCKSGFFGFPECKACNCDTRGSLSSFCTATGQCQCLRNFDGKRCDKCRIGFFGFPTCKECNCDAAGIKPLDGLPSGCNSSNAIKCTCKQNVQGKHCDTCKDLHYNLQFNNPKGCQKCRCSSQGTNGQLKNCDKVSGQCACKPHVSGLSCAFCKDGSTALRDYSIFGCKGCECDYGGSWDNSCNKVTGTCTCRRNVAGKRCSRVKSDGFYVKSLHHVRAEFEDATLSFGRSVSTRYLAGEFPGFSGRSYIAASSGQNSFDIIVSIPRPTKYRLLIRYVLDSTRPVFGQVTISPTDKVDPLPKGYENVQVVSIQFKSTATRSRTYADFLTVEKNGKEAEFFLSRGKWRTSLFVAPSKLLLDYLVMIPEEYYKAKHLRKRVQKPCEVDSTTEKFCVDYKYLNITRTDVITVPTKYGQLVGSKTLLPYAPFEGVVLNRLSQLYLPIPIQKIGHYVLMVTYYQEKKTVSDLIVGVTSGFTDQTARIRTFQCKYTFGCRQVAIDDENKVMSFYLFSNTRNMLTVGAQTMVAVESVTIVPYEKWNFEYTLPAEYCVRKKTGCLQTTYNIHNNAIRVDAEKLGQGMKPAYSNDPTVRAAYVAGDGVSLRIESKIDRGRYKILVQYYQPSHGSYNGRIIVQSGRSTALSLPFKHCPNVGGCRAVARDRTTSMVRSLYISDDVVITISIPAQDEVWIDYILFVPTRHYNSLMENQEPLSFAQDFVEKCGKNNFIINNSSPEFCKESMFTMTTHFNQGAASCDCNRDGSVSLVCDKLGGQCPCKQNVVGRQCDQCRGGYTEFPNCRRV